MKRSILCLLAALCLCLTACGRTQAPPETPTLVSPALSAQLNLLRDRVQPGTAGASLKAAIVAADLLDWADDPAPQENIDATVQSWLAAQSEEALERLPEQIDQLSGTVERLLTDYEGCAGLLEDAGLEGRGPWDAAAGEQVHTLLDLLDPSAS